MALLLLILLIRVKTTLSKMVLLELYVFLLIDIVIYL
jgi:hypothetical protein